MQRVGIVVLSHNRREDLLACLESVSRLRFRERDVIVFDNGSSDGSAGAAERAFPQFEVVRSDRNLGAAAGRNAALSRLRARGPYAAVLFLDDDARVEPGFLTHLCDALSGDPGAGIAFGKAFTAFPSKTLLTVGAQINLDIGTIRDLGEGEEDRGQYDAPRYVDACPSFGVLVRWDLLHELAGFDERFSPYGFEDYDLCLRAGRRGRRTRYVPQAVVYHKGCRFGRGPRPGYERAKAANYLRLMRAHASPLQQLCIALCLPLRAIGLAARLLRAGSPASILAQVRGALDAVLPARDRAK